MYNVDDATAALFRYHMDQGLDERQINQPSRYGYDEDDGYHFVNRDADGEISFEVQFNDDDGNATVSFPDGTEGDVCICDEEGEDGDED